MAKLPPTEPVFASDLTSQPIPVGDHAVIRVSPEWDSEYIYVLDAAREDVAEMLSVATKERRPGRKAKTAADNGQATDETPTGEGDDTPGDANPDTDDAKTTTPAAKAKGK